jgi:hypothetical protein
MHVHSLGIRICKYGNGKLQYLQSTLDKPPPFVFIKSWHYSEYGGESNSCRKNKMYLYVRVISRSLNGTWYVRVPHVKTIIFYAWVFTQQNILFILSSIILLHIFSIKSCTG